MGQKEKTSNRIALWATSILLIIGAVWGLLKIINSTSPDGQENYQNLSLTVSDSAWVKGNRQAKTVLMEYSDFECPACAFYSTMLTALSKEFGDNIAIVYRHFPLKTIHEKAEIAAYAAEAAGKQNKFWEMHDLIFKNQDEWAGKNDSESFFIKYAESLNLNIDEFKKDANSKETKNKVEKNYQEGLSARINYTPTFFLNGKKITPKNYEDFKNIIRQAIK